MTIDEALVKRIIRFFESVELGKSDYNMGIWKVSKSRSVISQEAEKKDIISRLTVLLNSGE